MALSALPLRSVEKKPGTPTRGFPFDVPVVRSLTRLTFGGPVTFLAGENGSGKSTLLEALAIAAGSTTVGSESVLTDDTLAPVRPLAEHLKLVWSKRTSRGFFMRAEDFFGYARRMAQLNAEMRDELGRVDRESGGRSAAARAYERLPYERELGEMQWSYGDGLDANSHGEGFLKLFRRRFTGPGLYLLDEPEAPLSPMRQLALLALLHEMVQQGGQFVIATHSPILMAYPDAAILSFDGSAIEAVDYESLEHVQVTRSFLADPQAYLRHLFNG